MRERTLHTLHTLHFCYWFESVTFHLYCEIPNSVKFITVVLALQSSNFVLENIF
jgi:hypothetical protein